MVEGIWDVAAAATITVGAEAEGITMGGREAAIGAGNRPVLLPTKD